MLSRREVLMAELMSGQTELEIVRNLGFVVYPLFLCVYPWCRSQIAYLRLGDRDLLILSFQRVHLLYRYKIPSRTSFRDTVQIKLPTTI
jgi:hypothetical protein